MELYRIKQFWSTAFRCIYYRPQRSWGKVMFLQASVILFTEGLPGPGGVPGPGGLLLGGVPGPGGAWSRGAGGDPPPPGTATAAGGTHPTGMHSCSL